VTGSGPPVPDPALGALLARADVQSWWGAERIACARHRVYRVQSREGALLVRLAPLTPRLATSIADEGRVLARVAAAGIAPELRYFDEDGGLVTRWIDGPAWSPAELGCAAGAEALARKLAKLHAIEIDMPAFDPLRAARAYGDALPSEVRDAPAVEVRLAALARELEAFVSDADCSRLAHNDLVPANVVGWPEPMLVDWEYAAPFDRRFDLACITALTPLDGRDRDRLLAATGLSPAARRELADVERLVRLLSWAWALAERARDPAAPHPSEWLKWLELAL